MPLKNVQVGIFYPADPVGTIPGGIDTFIRGILRWAPDDIEISLVGITTDPVARPVGVWTRCDLGRRSFAFLPVYECKDPTRQPRIPATLQYMFWLMWRGPARHFDVIESHRLEPFVLFLANKAPKNLFLHQNMDVLRNRDSDIRWKYLPSLYYKMERTLLDRIASTFIVRESAVEAYRRQYPDIANRFRFVPTWVDPDVFSAATPGGKAALRRDIFAPLGWGASDRVLVFVGRLDRQKDPLLLLSAFSLARRRYPDLRMVLVGSGVLLNEVEARIGELDLTGSVALMGLQPVARVASLLRASDAFVLASAYEGMPMCVLEAMGCGLPVASTDVGEIRRIVTPGVNGAIATTRTDHDVAAAIVEVVDNLGAYSGEPALAIAARYAPAKVLEPVYENYRVLAGRSEVRACDSVGGL